MTIESATISTTLYTEQTSNTAESVARARGATIELRRSCTVATFHEKADYRYFVDWLKERGYTILPVGASALCVAYAAPTVRGRP